ncbi:MAG: DNA lyase [Candidatus Aenigmatarchaeota archaeon]
MQLELNKLLEFYKLNKIKIKKFLNSCNNKNDEDLFGELCFCILTPQSKAKVCRKAVNNLKADKKLFSANLKELKNYLRGVRFPNVKAQRIIEARKVFPELKGVVNSNPEKIREWLIKNVNGLGLKESAHFMRNIGFKGIPIIDKHIQDFLVKIGKDKGGKINKKRYLELEKKFLELAKELKIPPEELDIAIWLYESKEKEFYG